MQYQLRIYNIKPGEMADWVHEWRTMIVPLRRKLGFEIAGAWSVEDSDRFVWVLAYGGSQSWEEADRAYYGSAERRSINPDPARHVASSETSLMRIQDSS
ncbi:MAG: NIPSNAP family protein [Candidatus Dormibacteraceae bacterium]